MYLEIGRKTRARRSSKWPTLSKSFLAGKVCAVCGRKDNLVAHHKKPFHLFPELELEPSNLIPLCEGKGVNCHLAVGHLYYWPSYNPTVDVDAAYIRSRIDRRPTINNATPQQDDSHAD